MEDARTQARLGLYHHRSRRQGRLALDAGANFSGHDRHHARPAIVSAQSFHWQEDMLSLGNCFVIRNCFVENMGAKRASGVFSLTLNSSPGDDLDKSRLFIRRVCGFEAVDYFHASLEGCAWIVPAGGC